MDAMEARDDYFKLTRDCCGQLSFSAKQKCTADMRMFALGTAADAVSEMVGVGESTCLKATLRFVRVVVVVFGAEYVRETNAQDTKKLLAIGEAGGFSECSDQSIACIDNAETAPKVCECTKVIQKRPPSY
ncbi:hypothetical protein ZWY2020_017196 [Hordeum vulgare]|nr:hypothetical protein ZWY2020_017196 [Hordeum vulgare]